LTLPVWATNAIRCLAVQPDERFQALVDQPFARVGLTLCDAATAVGAQAQCAVIPDSQRPLRRASEPFLASLAATDAVVFWQANVYDGELAPFRLPIYRRLPETGTRLAYGARMDQSILDREMSADYGEVQERCARLVAAIDGATHVRVTTSGGSDCTFDVTGREWKLDDGRVDRPGSFANLPAGEIFIAPLRTGADGVCVIDRSIALEGIGLVEQPIRLTFQSGRIVDVAGGREAERVRRAIAEAGEGADVVAELGIGTNDKARITGNVITDEKALGTAHVAFGDNTGSYGGDNHAQIHVDGIMADATIEADGRVVMRRGEIL
jgi:leucyl aminopeptidase (aminopeptidase T)